MTKLAQNTDPKRRAELAKIHLLAKELALDRDTYEQLLWTVARVRSAKDLDQHGRQSVIEHMRARGGGGARRSTPADARAPLIRKIRAQLNAAQRDDAYADATARHMFKVARYEWCSPDQLHRIVAAFAIDATRRAKRGAKT